MVGTEAVEVGRAGEEIARQIAILRRQKLLEGDAQLPIGPDDDRAQVPPKAGLTILAEKAAGATFGGAWGRLPDRRRPSGNQVRRKET